MNTIYPLAPLTLIILQSAAQDPESLICYDCPVAANLIDPQVLKYAQYIVQEIQKENNCTSLENVGNQGCAYILERILNATSEVLGGELQHYDLIVEYIERRPDLISAQYYLCSAYVLVDSRGDSQQITIQSCKNTEFCANCWVGLTPEDPKVLIYAQDALKEIENTSNCSGCTYQIIDRTTITTQYEFGANYYYILHIRSQQTTGDVENLQKQECEVLVHVNTSRFTETVYVISCKQYVN